MKELQIYIMRQIKKINNSIPNFDFRNFFYKNKIFDKKNKLS